jgi:4-hydroxy-2-oxoheptanedioate aldolase
MAMKIKGQKTMKQRLNEGEVLFGTFYKFNCPPVVEMLGLVGMDFIIVDCEHSDYSYLDLQNICRVANGVGMNAVIRVPGSGTEHLLHAGDMGAQGIQVPNVKTVEEAAKAAGEMRYYPAGVRGLGLTTRASGYCLTDYRDYIKYVNEEFLSVIMIENKELAGQVERLCDIPQLDVLFVGTGDMSQSCGLTGETGHPEVQKIVKHVLDTARARGKKAGVYAGTLKDAQRYADMGFQYIGFSSEMNFIAEKLKEVMAGINEIKRRTVS